jgi:hypothetical protein
MQLNSKDGTDYLPTAGAAGYALRRDYSRDTVNGQTLGEPAGVNSLRNNTMQGAAVGVIGSGGAFPTYWTRTGTPLSEIPTEIVAVGTVNGMAYIDIKLSGTPASNGTIAISPEATSTISAVSGEVWSGSSFFALVGGSLTNLASEAVQLRPATIPVAQPPVMSGRLMSHPFLHSQDIRIQ